MDSKMILILKPLMRLKYPCKSDTYRHKVREQFTEHLIMKVVLQALPRKLPFIVLRWLNAAQCRTLLNLSTKTTLTVSNRIFKLHKIRERKGKNLTKNWRDYRRKGIRKLNWNIFTVTAVSQSKENECMWTHDTDGVTSEFLKGATRGLRGMDGGKFQKGNYWRLIPGLCLEDRMNW